LAAQTTEQQIKLVLPPIPKSEPYPAFSPGFDLGPPVLDHQLRVETREGQPMLIETEYEYEYCYACEEEATMYCAECGFCRLCCTCTKGN
jgi:hypothetical protein